MKFTPTPLFKLKKRNYGKIKINYKLVEFDQFKSREIR